MVGLVIWLVGWLIGLLVGWLDGWLVGWLAGWLVGWLAGCLVGWLAGYLVGWLAGCLVGWMVGWFYATPLHPVSVTFKTPVHASTSFVHLCTLYIVLKRFNSVSTCVQRSCTRTKNFILNYFLFHIYLNSITCQSHNHFRYLNFVFPIIKN